jgi:NitT/TauT family transport system substrate-binding protein
MKSWKRVAVIFAVLGLLATACGSDDDGGSASGPADCDGVNQVTLQLQWFAQAQFAGYYAAVDEGLYADHCLDVTILEGGFDIVPQQQLASGVADFAISWVPKALVSREEGLDIVNVGQIFQRSGTLQVSFADSGISGPSDLAGKNVGSWGFGNEFELLAGSRQAGVEPGVDYEIVQQNFDMLALINGEIDAAQAMIYNEYAQVLETENPETGELFTADDLTVIDWNDVGTAMLQDAIWADGSRLDDEVYQDVTTRFIAASVEGWAWCRDNADDCVDVVLNNGPTLGKSHQAWQLNEVSNLIWPSPDGAGVINQGLWDQTVQVATSEAVLTGDPSAGSFTNEWAEAAQKLLADRGVDAIGNDFSKIEVELNAGGE